MKLYPSVSLIICIWSLSILTIFYFSLSVIPHTNLVSDNFIRNLGSWDGGHYLFIAQNGYLQKSQYIFFPLLPLTINFVSRIIGDYLISGVLVSFLSFFLAANLFYQLVYLEFGKSYARRALLALLFFPLSFHFLTIYTESLFFLLTVSTFLFVRKKNYLLATIAASLASATRLTGIGVVLSLIVYVYLTQGINKKTWLVLFSPLGLMLYCLYLYYRMGDPFYFIQSEALFWQTGLKIPGSVLFHSFKQLIEPMFIVNNFRDLLDFIFATFGILSVWQTFRKLSFDFAIFSLVSITLPLFSPTIAALPRYILTIFPVFIVLSFYKNQYLILGYQIICLMLLAIYAILFINGYWVS